MQEVFLKKGFSAAKVASDRKEGFWPLEKLMPAKMVDQALRKMKVRRGPRLRICIWLIQSNATSRR